MRMLIFDVYSMHALAGLGLRLICCSCICECPCYNKLEEQEHKYTNQYIKRCCRAPLLRAWLGVCMRVCDSHECERYHTLARTRTHAHTTHTCNWQSQPRHDGKICIKNLKNYLNRLLFTCNNNQTHVDPSNSTSKIYTRTLCFDQVTYLKDTLFDQPASSALHFDACTFYFMNLSQWPSLYRFERFEHFLFFRSRLWSPQHRHDSTRQLMSEN